VNMRDFSAQVAFYSDFREVTVFYE